MHSIGKFRPALIGSVFLFGLAGCDVCENTLVSVIASPDGLNNAFLYTRSCGATTGISTHISILPAGEKLRSQSGNTFVADGDHGRVPTGANGELDVKVRWLSNDQLAVDYPAGSRLFRSETVKGPVHVEYSSRAP